MSPTKCPQCGYRLTSEPRTLDQNSLFHLWCEEFATQLKDRTAQEVKRDIKLNIGIPILCEGNAKFRKAWEEQTEGMPYERKLAWMDCIAVTSAMTTKQLTDCMDEVSRIAARNNVKLTHP